MPDVPRRKSTMARSGRAVSRDVPKSRDRTGDPSGARWDAVLAGGDSSDPWADPQRVRHRRHRRRLALRRWLLLGLTLAAVAAVFVWLHATR
jgi:hypothetical protein